MSMSFNTHILVPVKTRSNIRGGIRGKHFLGIVQNDGVGIVFKCR